MKLCSKCKDVAIDTIAAYGKPETVIKHHRTLSELKACAHSGNPAPCPLCRLMWASVRAMSTDAQVQSLLNNWPAGYSLALHNPGTQKEHETPMGSIGVATAKAPWTTVKKCIGRLDLFADDGDPAAGEIVGRFSEVNSLSRHSNTSREQSIALIKAWLKDCCSSHNNCGGNHSRLLPQRLIDVSDSSNTRLIETRKGDKGRYVALSYCWGEKRGNESIHKVKLKRDNLKEHKKRMDRSRMTLTHLEAIQVTRELGFKYIWIDALCIMQDSNSDWEQQAHMVPDIYGNAEVTLMAGRSDDSREGFLELSNWYKPAAKPVELPYETYESEEGTCIVGLPRTGDVGPTDQRAWCFQESILSRRIVAYGMEQLKFQCREGVQYEDATGRETTEVERIWYNISMLGKQALPSPSLKALPLVIDQWYPLTRMYSQRKLFDPVDCFAALSGVARKFQTALASATGAGKPRYLAGLWEVDMIYGLLWRSSRIDAPYPNKTSALRRARKRQPPPEPPKVVERAPSWSWMALEGPITVHPSRHPSIRPYCFPARKDGHWTAQDWGIDMVIHEQILNALPFKLEVKGRPRRVRVPSHSTINRKEGAHLGDFPHCFTTDTEKNMEKHGVVLKDNEKPPSFGDKIIATALFDVAKAHHSDSWAMPVLAYDNKPAEGLLLEQKKNGAFTRVGVFWVKEFDAFREVKERVVEIE